jgi:cell division protein FtsZ
MEAAQQAISSPLLDNISIAGATGVLINITGGEDLTLGEVTQISEAIHDAAGDEAEIIFGAVNDPAMHGEVRITVIATGFDKTGALADALAGGVSQRAAAGVLPFRDRAKQAAAGGIVKPAEAPKRGGSPQMPLNPELSEMEIPTFIRRQMD